MADTTINVSNAGEPMVKAAPAPGGLTDGATHMAPAVAEPAKEELPALSQAITAQVREAQALLHAAEKAPGDLAKLPAAAVTTLPKELASTEAYLEEKLPVIEALPLPDFVFGGGVLVAVVILQAIGLRLLTGHFDKRAQRIQQRPAWWSVDLLLGFTVFRMLGLHLMSIVLWSAALVYGGIIPQWAAAARFAALSYTTLGSHQVLTDEWYLLSPIIAISGMFTFAWTASVLVSIVGRCNELRGVVREARRAKRGVTGPSTGPNIHRGDTTTSGSGEERAAGS